MQHATRVERAPADGGRDGDAVKYRSRRKRGTGVGIIKKKECKYW
jgi:hypothetical protein